MRSDEDGELTRNDSTLSRLSQLLNDHDGDRYVNSSVAQPRVSSRAHHSPSLVPLLCLGRCRMIAGESGQYEHLRKSKDELKAFTRKQKGLKAYYERQSECLFPTESELINISPVPPASPRPRLIHPCLSPSHLFPSDEILDAYSEVDELLSSSFAKDVLHTFSKQHNGAGGPGRSRYGALESRNGTPSVRSLSRERGTTGGRGEEEALLGNGKGGGGGHKEEQSRSKERRETIMLNGKSSPSRRFCVIGISRQIKGPR